MHAVATPSGVRRFSGPVARRLAMGSLVLALGVSVATCRLDKLINPATDDRLTVTPTTWLDSVHAGSGASTRTLRVASADGATLSWTATKSAVWVSLSSDSGSTPDSVVVTIDPDTLSETLHQDTIVFVSAQNMVKVPLVFDVLPPTPELLATPTAQAETAFVGSAQPDTFSLLIANTGGLPLTWSAVADSPWIALSKDSGGAPPTDTSVVTLTPGSLPVGTHSGAITVTAPGAGPPQIVPVTYVIQPCAEPLITLDAVRSDSVVASDCAAPQRAGSQAKVYALQANQGDTLSFRLTAAFNAYLILTNRTGVAVLDETDQCAPASTACLLNFIVSTTDRYLIEVTTTNSGETGAFTLSAVKELSPSAPAAGQFRANGTTAIGVGAVTPESTVVFKATLNDPNSQDSVRLELELTNLATGTDVDSSAFVPRGTPVALSVTGLTDNDAYHWRARTCDQTGRCSTWFSFGGNVDPAPDFKVNWKPENPTIGTLDQIGANGSMAVGGGTGGTRNANVTVTFTAGVTDPDPDDLIAIEVEYKRVGTAFDSTTVRGSGVPTGGTATHAVSIPVPLLLNDTYHWRARVCDQTNRCSVWVPFGGNAESATDFQSP
jgi:hypothetical protein